MPLPLFAQPTTERFTRDGVTYVYTVTPAGADRRVIEGHSTPGPAGFRLVVSGDRVEGTFGGQPVAFRRPAGASATLASRSATKTVSSSAPPREAVIR